VPFVFFTGLSGALSERWEATPRVEKPAEPEIIIGALKFVLSPEARAIVVRSQRGGDDSPKFARLEQAISEGEERIMRVRRCIARLASTGADTSAGERVVATMTAVLEIFARSSGTVGQPRIKIGSVKFGLSLPPLDACTKAQCAASSDCGGCFLAVSGIQLIPLQSWITSFTDRQSRKKRLTISSRMLSPGRSDADPDMKKTIARSSCLGSLRDHWRSGRRMTRSRSSSIVMPEGEIETASRSPLLKRITAEERGLCRTNLFTRAKMGIGSGLHQSSCLARNHIIGDTARRRRRVNRCRGG